MLAFVDIDPQQNRVYVYSKQGAAFGHTKIQGKSLLVRELNALAATIGTPLGAPVIAATRLRGGNAGSACGAASFATEAVPHPRATGQRDLGGAGRLGVLLRGVKTSASSDVAGTSAAVACPARALAGRKISATTAAGPSRPLPRPSPGAGRS